MQVQDQLIEDTVASSVQQEELLEETFEPMDLHESMQKEDLLPTTSSTEEANHLLQEAAASVEERLTNREFDWREEYEECQEEDDDQPFLLWWRILGAFVAIIAVAAFFYYMQKRRQNSTEEEEETATGLTTKRQEEQTKKSSDVKQRYTEVPTVNVEDFNHQQAVSVSSVSNGTQRTFASEEDQKKSQIEQDASKKRIESKLIDEEDKRGKQSEKVQNSDVNQTSTTTRLFDEQRGGGKEEADSTHVAPMTRSDEGKVEKEFNEEHKHIFVKDNELSASAESNVVKQNDFHHLQQIDSEIARSHEMMKYKQSEEEEEEEEEEELDESKYEKNQHEKVAVDEKKFDTVIVSDRMMDSKKEEVLERQADPLRAVDLTCVNVDKQPVFDDYQQSGTNIDQSLETADQQREENEYKKMKIDDSVDTNMRNTSDTIVFSPNEPIGQQELNAQPSRAVDLTSGNDESGFIKDIVNLSIGKGENESIASATTKEQLIAASTSEVDSSRTATNLDNLVSENKSTSFIANNLMSNNVESVFVKQNDFGLINQSSEENKKVDQMATVTIENQHEMPTVLDETEISRTRKKDATNLESIQVESKSTSFVSDNLMSDSVETVVVKQSSSIIDRLQEIQNATATDQSTTPDDQSSFKENNVSAEEMTKVVGSTEDKVETLHEKTTAMVSEQKNKKLEEDEINNTETRPAITDHQEVDRFEPIDQDKKTIELQSTQKEDNIVQLKRQNEPSAEIEDPTTVKGFFQDESRLVETQEDLTSSASKVTVKSLGSKTFLDSELMEDNQLTYNVPPLVTDTSKQEPNAQLNEESAFSIKPLETEQSEVTKEKEDDNLQQQRTYIIERDENIQIQNNIQENATMIEKEEENVSKEEIEVKAHQEQEHKKTDRQFQEERGDCVDDRSKNIPSIEIDQYEDLVYQDDDKRDERDNESQPMYEDDEEESEEFNENTTAPEIETYEEAVVEAETEMSEKEVDDEVDFEDELDRALLTNHNIVGVAQGFDDIYDHHDNNDAEEVVAEVNPVGVVVPGQVDAAPSFMRRESEKENVMIESTDSLDNMEDDHLVTNSILEVIGAKNVEQVLMKMDTLEAVAEVMRMAGLESSNLIFGIDYTASNKYQGEMCFGGKNLHTVEKGMLNPYQQVIAILGKTLAPFASSGFIAAYGFGDVKTSDVSVFPLTAHDFCRSFDQVLDIYNQVTPKVILSGPTNFAPLIYQAMDICKQVKDYHILVIVADGQVTNERATRRAIVDACKYPISIIVVGVGDGPWDMMRVFDDSLPKRPWDNFHFVEFQQITGKAANPDLAFAVQSLLEIPDQYKKIKAMGLLNFTQ